ncbi:DUF2628 domain-containing protein [Rhodococcus triatomae]|uniref:DUF2628 domain-containing protein n=1 Tax=Rhodococcus triatomae TaxID=300028 RepID=A0A1G8K3M3_9NOCA|nr:DUF2628 domain-containing protein [Rhodococcus triatomae]QNG18817.1 DUF2628 domain-containing protein [Rhodococcus triatomae]QNG25272.1 DUF2628 domain-containing protein [Rhodococcus triatomae]SDI38086.1 Protein of unknown function [Rhodococcus triatomae]
MPRMQRYSDDGDSVGAVHDVSVGTGERYEGFRPVWKWRFQFFDEFGVPGLGRPDPRFQAALKKLGFWARSRMVFNIWCVVFGVFYLMFLRLWRQAVLYLAAVSALALVEVFVGLPSSAATGAGTGIAVLFASRVNVHYYRLVTTGKETWSL